MKKRILSLLLVLAMLVTVSVFAVEATEPAVDPNPTKTSFDAAVAAAGEEAATLKFYCEACGSEQTWTKGSISSKGALSKTTGHVYIPSTGLTNTTNSVFGGPKLCLYLNGNWTRSIEGSTSNAYLARLYKKSTSTAAGYQNVVNIMGNGTAAMSATGKPANDGVQNGAVINTSTMTTAGGENKAASGKHTLNIYEGVIIDGSGADLRNKTTNGGAAIAIGNICGTVNMYGGTIKGGTATHGGAVRVASGTFNFYGGTIEGGVGSSSSSSYGGGSVFMTGACTFNMYKGAKITGATSKYWGGNVRIAGTNAVFNMYGGIIENGVCNGSSSTYKRGGNVQVDSDSFFNFYGGTIQNTTETYTAWAGGCVYSTGTFVMDEDAEITLSDEAIQAGAQRDEEAKIIGGKADRGATVTVYGSKPFTLKSGTIEGGHSGHTGGAVHNEGNFRMEGGTINGGYAATKGGAVYAAGRTFTMTGGTINGGTADDGGAIAVSASALTDNLVGTFNMEGGTINGGEVTGAGAAVYVGADVYEAKVTEKQKQTVDGVETEVEVLVGYVQNPQSGTFNMTGGTINGGTEEKTGKAADGVVMVSSTAYYTKTVQDVDGVPTVVTGDTQNQVHGVFNLNGENAVINAANATLSNRGGAVCLLGGIFNHANGTIKGASVTDVNGGAVYMAGNGVDVKNAAGKEVELIIGSAYNMTGGTIEGGSVKASTKAVYGGNVYVTGTAIFTMDNGTIQGGKVQGVSGKNSWGGNVAVYGKGQFIMNNGTIKEGFGPSKTQTYSRGGNVSVNGGGTFTMNNGTIKDGYLTWVGANVAMGSSTSTFTMKGGEISGGSKVSHGSVSILDGTFNMEGGTITGVTEENKAIGGGAVLCEGSFNMTGGTIKDGHAYNGGNVYVGGTGIFTLDGGVIKNGNAIKNGSNTGYGGNIAVSGGKNDSQNPGSLVLKKGKVLTGTAEIFGGNISIEGEGTAAEKRSTLTMTEAAEGDLLIAAGVSTRASSGFGGNLHIGNYADVTINSGLFTTEYTDGENTYVGKATNGVNIGAWAQESTLTLNGGTFAGAIDRADESINLGSNGNLAFTLGNAVVHDERSEGKDIHIVGVANVTVTDTEDMDQDGNVEEEITYAENRGKLTITDAFTGKLVLGIGNNPNAIVDNVVNTDIAVAQGFTGKDVVLRYDGNNYPVYGDGEKLVIAQAALLDGQNVLVGGTYADVTAAYAENKGEANAQNYIKLFNMDGQTITAAEGALIDVNGNNVTVDSAAAVAVIDSATNDYDDTDAAKITFANAVGTGADVNLTIDGQQGTRRYALIKNDDGTYGAHRFYITQRNVGIRVNEDDAAPDLIYSGSFRGTQTFAANVEAFGIDFQHEGASLYKVNYLDHEQAFTSGNMIYGKNVNIVVSEQAAMDGYGEKLIKGVPYITLKGGVELTAQVIEEATSVKAQVESFKANYATLSDSQKAIYDAMVVQSGALFTTLGWDYAVA